jgi:nucleoside-diphosphate-sugar epimerase
MAEPLHRVLLTGASGFVGRALRSRLAASVDAFSFGSGDWRARLDAAPLAHAAVIHLAARAHSAGTEAQFHDDNVEKTRALAEAALRAGARRFVFLSSLKVHGEDSGARAFGRDDPLDPRDAYARSKAAAEQALMDVASRGLPVAIVRSPLVYGPGARANLGALLRIARSPWPLPFASLDAPRSFVHVEDLAELLVLAASRPEAIGKRYIAAHRDGASVREVVTLMRRALGRGANLWPIPPRAIETLGAWIGQGEKARRLTRPLLGDPSAAEGELGWRARVTIGEAVEDLVRGRVAGAKP